MGRDEAPLAPVWRTVVRLDRWTCRPVMTRATCHVPLMGCTGGLAVILDERAVSDRLRSQTAAHCRLRIPALPAKVAMPTLVEKPKLLVVIYLYEVLV